MGAGSVTYFHIKAVFIIKVSRCSASNVGGGLFAAFDCRKSISLLCHRTANKGNHTKRKKTAQPDQERDNFAT